MGAFPLRQAVTDLEIENLPPDAAGLAKLNGKAARQLTYLALHKQDLEFVLGCLELINQTEHPVVRDALWQSAIARFIKCFVGGTVRSRLNENQVYMHEPINKKAFLYFKTLRDKHVLHDKSAAYAQCIPCAVINAGDKDHKVEKIVTLKIVAKTLDQANYDRLRSLATRALTLVEKKYVDLCNLIIGQLESESYESLSARDQASFWAPDVSEIGNRRRH